MIKKLNKMHPSSVGFFQALGVGIYCFLISGVLNYLDHISVSPPKIWGLAILLFLLVFSVVITSLLIFGYPIYLTIKGNIKKALSTFGFTVVFFVLIIIVLLFIFVV